MKNGERLPLFYSGTRDTEEMKHSVPKNTYWEGRDSLTEENYNLLTYLSVSKRVCTLEPRG